MTTLLLLLCGSPGLLAMAAERPFDASLAGLVGADGRELDVRAFAGKPRIVLFGFASCADVCPLTLVAVRQALVKLGPRADDVAALFISVDHERDKPAQLAEYVRAFDRRIHGLTGRPEALRRVAQGHGVFFEKRWTNPAAGAYVYDHTAVILVIGADGRLLASVSTSAPPDEVADRVVAALQPPVSSR